MKVLSVIGAHPQFVKAAPVNRARRQVAHEVLVHTGQCHDCEMSAVMLTRPKLSPGGVSSASLWRRARQ